MRLTDSHIKHAGDNINCNGKVIVILVKFVANEFS